jgi:hypothetical protein
MDRRVFLAGLKIPAALLGVGLSVSINLAMKLLLLRHIFSYFPMWSPEGSHINSHAQNLWNCHNDISGGGHSVVLCIQSEMEMMQIP